MFRIVVLGSGGAIPSPNRNVSCVGIRHNGKVYVFDACEGMQKQMMKYKLSYYKTCAIFISHLHPDHFLGIPGLAYTLQLSNFEGTLRIIGPKGIKRVVEGLLAGNVPKFMRIEEFHKEGVVFENGDLSVLAFKVKHSNTSYGYEVKQKGIRKFDEEKAKMLGIKGRMFRDIEEKGCLIVGKKKIMLDDVSWIKDGKRIVYTGDTIKCNNVAEHAKHADVLIHDATFIEADRKDADEKMHATALDAAKTAEEAECGILVLIHISNKYKSDEEHIKEAKNIFGEAIVAKDGLEIHI